MPRLDDTGIALEDLAGRLLRELPPTSSAVVLLDCCYSGQAALPPDSRAGSADARGTPVAFLNQARAAFKEIGQRVVVAACDVEELAFERVGLQHGVFTACVLDHWHTYPGAVDPGSLFRAVAEGLQKQGAQQDPVTSGSYKGRLVLRPPRVSGAAPALVPRPATPPFMAPDLPRGFVPRPQEFERLKRLLLDPAGGGAVGITTALTGAGGFGKTTLAAALCHDADIRAAFPDGILWATLDEHPDLTRELARLYAALTDTRPAFVDAEDAAIQVTAALAARSCLLVVDDVWDEAELRPFLRGGPGCTRLITTRNRTTLPSDCRSVAVDTMQAQQATALLGGGLPDLDPALLDHLARRLGRWPLLLRLANRMMRDWLADAPAAPATEALAYVEVLYDQHKLIAFDVRNAKARTQAAARTLNASLERLTPTEQDRYAELAIFPKDTDIPLTTVAQLWGATAEMDALRVDQLCLTLRDLGLLQRLDRRAGTLRLHDVIWDYLAPRVSAAVHVRLLVAWGDPHTLPDAYAWQQIAYHLVAAGQADVLRHLAFDYPWLQAKLAATGIAALVRDLELVTADPAVAQVAGALRLAAHILTADPTQLGRVCKAAS